MLNRRGAKDAVHAALMRHAANCAMLLVGIDQLKMIVAMRGHATTDAVVANTADAIRKAPVTRISARGSERVNS